MLQRNGSEENQWYTQDQLLDQLSTQITRLIRDTSKPNLKEHLIEHFSLLPEHLDFGMYEPNIDTALQSYAHEDSQGRGLKDATSSNEKRWTPAAKRKVKARLAMLCSVAIINAVANAGLSGISPGLLKQLLGVPANATLTWQDKVLIALLSLAVLIIYFQMNWRPSVAAEHASCTEDGHYASLIAFRAALEGALAEGKDDQAVIKAAAQDVLDRAIFQRRQHIRQGASDGDDVAPEVIVFFHNTAMAETVPSSAGHASLGRNSVKSYYSEIESTINSIPKIYAVQVDKLTRDACMQDRKINMPCYRDLVHRQFRANQYAREFFSQKTVGDKRESFNAMQELGKGTPELDAYSSLLAQLDNKGNGQRSPTFSNVLQQLVQNLESKGIIPASNQKIQLQRKYVLFSLAGEVAALLEDKHRHRSNSNKITQRRQEREAQERELLAETHPKLIKRFGVLGNGIGWINAIAVNSVIALCAGLSGGHAFLLAMSSGQIGHIGLGLAALAAGLLFIAGLYQAANMTRRSIQRVSTRLGRYFAVWSTYSWRQRAGNFARFIPGAAVGITTSVALAKLSQLVVLHSIEYGAVHTVLPLPGAAVAAISIFIFAFTFMASAALFTEFSMGLFKDMTTKIRHMPRTQIARIAVVSLVLMGSTAFTGIMAAEALQSASLGIVVAMAFLVVASLAVAATRPKQAGKAWWKAPVSLAVTGVAAGCAAVTIGVAAGIIFGALSGIVFMALYWSGMGTQTNFKKAFENRAVENRSVMPTLLSGSGTGGGGALLVPKCVTAAHPPLSSSQNGTASDADPQASDNQPPQSRQ